MPNLPATVRRHFLSWQRPLLAQAAEWLAHDWSGEGALDLSHVLAIVPTRQSGRRLREALAEYAATRKAAVFPPRVQTPDTLLAQGAAAPEVASRLEALLAWTDVLGAIDLDRVSDVLPVAPPRRDFAWAYRLADNFFRLQTQLMEAGLALADVAARAGAEFPEAERWRQLAWLEEQQVRRLASLGRREPHAARRAFAQAPRLTAGITRVVMIAAADPLPLAIETIGRLAREVPVDVVVFAPEAEAEAFDEWGRPRPAAWERRALVLPDWKAHVHLCANPADEAERAAAMAARHGPEADGYVAIGIADPDTLPLLENGLSRAGLASYNPEGRPRRSEGLHALLSALAALAREATFDAVATLARCPDFLTALATRGGPNTSAARWLKELDALRSRHLPADLGAARRSARAGGELRAGLDFVADLEAALTRGTFPGNALAALGLIFRDRRFDLSRDNDARAAEGAGAWREVMREIAAVRADFPAVKTAEWWEIALRMFGESRRTEEKFPGALDLQGWLELLWEDAPQLLVTGLNDGLVPEAIVGDAFLPESLRERLGLKTNATRFARDAYLLQALAACRAGEGGQLDLFFAKTAAAGDPLRPSRLLLSCADEELPERIAFLFRAVGTTRTNLPWTRAWRLTPRREPPPASVSVTALRAWLACPFRFYLAHVLRMEPVDPAKSELDARDFGTLCHAALEAMASAPALRDCTDEQVLREFLLDRFDGTARKIFGEQHALPLVVQLESARQRLARAAAIQARDRAEGWVIERAEWKFSLELGGLEVRGKIDRIDRHESSGVRRVLDYKTSDTAVPPLKAHVRPLRVNDQDLPAWMRLVLNGRDYVWADLQLPLYLRALESEPEAAGPRLAGYFNLPKAVGETGIVVWPELADELLAAAGACADGVAAAIRAGEFWPPKEIAAERDVFAALFHHGAVESVEDGWLVVDRARGNADRRVAVQAELELGVPGAEETGGTPTLR